MPRRKVMRGLFEGVVVFFEGCHYPSGHEGDLSYRLMWDAQRMQYEFWDGQGGSHAERYHSRSVELQAGE